MTVGSYPVVPFGQGFKDMNLPIKELMKFVNCNKIAFAGIP